ncbi:MAG: hypothetical protein ABL927_09750 [Bdellovibrionales bacterium]
MKSLFVVFLMSLISFSSFAGDVINDLPNTVWSCRDNVSDGGKAFVIYKDQFGQYSTRLIQKDQFNGDTVLAEFLSVNMVNHIPGMHTYIPFEQYSGSSQNLDVSFKMLINVLPNNSGSGELTLTTDGQISNMSFFCSRK